MSHRLDQFARAKADVAEIIDYMAPRSVSSAERFLAALQDPYDFLLDNPGAGVRMESDDPRLSDVRQGTDFARAALGTRL